MLTFALLTVIILLLRNQVRKLPMGGTRQTREEKYSRYVMALIVVLAAFRSEEVGADTPGYMREYGEMARLSWDAISVRFVGYSLYYYMSKVFSTMHMPLFVWFGFVELFYVFSMKLFIDRYSNDKLLSWLIFSTMGLFAFSLAGLKQVMGMGFMMYAYLAFTNENQAKFRYLYTFLLVFAAYMCHSVCLVFLPAFALYFIRNSRCFYIFAIAIIAIIAIGGESILTGAALQYEESTGNSHFATYLEFESNHSPVMLIFYICMILFCIPGFRKFHKEEQDLFKVSFAFCAIACSLQVLAFLSPHAFRFAFLFLPFYMSLLPKSMMYSSGHIIGLQKTLIVCSLVFYFLYVNRSYVYAMDLIF